MTNECKIICSENEDLKKRVIDLDGKLRKLGGDSENKVKILTQECERLNSVVEKKNIEIRNLGG